MLERERLAMVKKSLGFAGDDDEDPPERISESSLAGRISQIRRARTRGASLISNLVSRGIPTIAWKHRKDERRSQELTKRIVENRVFKTGIFTIMDNVYTVTFIVEFLLKFAAFGKSYFLNRWNLVDQVVIVASVLDVWVVPVLSSSSTERFAALINWCRSLRLLRIVKILQAIPELMLVTEGLLSSLKSMFWIFALVSLILYTASVYCTEAVGGKTNVYAGRDTVVEAEDFNNYRYFGTVGRSMMSLIGLILLSEWSLICRPVFEKQPYIIFVLVALVVLTTYGVMNIIIGVVVERTTVVMQRLAAASEEQHVEEKMKLLHRLKHLMFEIDADSDRILSIEEMRKGAAENEDLQALIRQLDFPENFTTYELHRMLDSDGSGQVTSEEFILGFARLVHNTDFRRDCMFQSSIGLLLSNQRTFHEEVMNYLHRTSVAVHEEFNDLRRALALDVNNGTSQPQHAQQPSNFRPVWPHVDIPCKRSSKYSNTFGSDVGFSVQSILEPFSETQSNPSTSRPSSSVISRPSSTVIRAPVIPEQGVAHFENLHTLLEVSPLSLGGTCQREAAPITSPRIGVTPPETPPTTPMNSPRNEWKASHLQLVQT